MIAAIPNHVRPVEVPFIFAGDGTNITIPGMLPMMYRQSLKACKAIAEKAFHLKLTTSIVSVEELYQQRF
ncbi:MAG: DUF3095 family protein [Balneolaceae bacterium]